jgi:hypothetical protein
MNGTQNMPGPNIGAFDSNRFGLLASKNELNYKMAELTF